jgi:tetratricopeptide (TPR) repeat protein
MAFDKRKALQSALSFAKQGKWDKAIAEYQAILKADPNDLTVCNNLGDLYARSGRAADAIEQYLKLGQLYRADGLSVKAIAVYKKIVKLDPIRTEAYLACADLYEEQGLLGEAKLQLAIAAEQYGRAGNSSKVIEVYQRLAQIDPANHVLLAKLAELTLREGKREAAAAEYERAAEAAQAAGQVAESKRLFQRVRDLVPESPQANLILGEERLREGKYAEATEALSRTTAGDATNARAWCLLGEAHLGLGQPSEAVTALTQALELHLPGAEVWPSLAAALVQAGRSDEGITLCLRLSEEATSRGNSDEAIAVCRDLLAAAPHLAPVHAHLVGLLQDLGRDDDARSAAYAMAAAHEACGETDAAIHVYYQLLDRDPSDEEAQRRLEVLERRPVPSPEPEDLGLPTAETTPEELPLPAPEAEPGEVPHPTAEAVRAVAEEPVATWEGAPLEGPESLESPPETVLSLGGVSPLRTGGVFDLETRSGQVFELDESGELAGIRYSPQAPDGGALDRLGVVDGPRVELPADSAREALSGSGAIKEEEGDLGEAAEQLAEAEVYLKYGLTEKARERLLEVARMAPDNLGARRRLKALYLESSEIEAACAEILAIARILWTRGEQEAARGEIQEGLSLAPDHQELQGFLAGPFGVEETPGADGRGGSRLMESPLAESPAFEFPESIEFPEAPGPEDELSVASGLEADGEGKKGAPPESGPAGVTAPEVAAPEPASAEMVPPAEAVLPFPPETARAEASLRELSEEVGLEADLSAPQEEDLPPEFDLLLEQPAEEPALVLEAGEGDLDQVMAEDLAEGEFYLSQGMGEEARVVYRRMEARAPLHPSVIQLGSRLEPSYDALPAELPEMPAAGLTLSTGGAENALAGVSEAPGPPGAFETGADILPEDIPFLEPMPPAASVAPVSRDASPDLEPNGTTPPPVVSVGPQEVAGDIQAEIPPPLIPSQTPPEEPASPESVVPKLSVSQSGGAADRAGYINLGAELEEDLAAEERAAAASAGAPLIEDLLREFRRGVGEQLDEKDFETHFNLGNAYKDMDLYEEAIQEFRLAAQDPARVLTCASLMGQCYLAKGKPDAALRELRAGLEIQGHPSEAYYGLRYELGGIYETQGNLDQALEAFESLRGENPRFRDVQSRVAELRARLQQHAASGRAGPLQAGEPPKRPKDVRKKISFI